MNPVHLLKGHFLVYITRDIERALGLPLDTPDYFIISNATHFAKQVAAGHKNVLLIEEERLLDTRELLEHAQTVNFINNCHLEPLGYTRDKLREAQSRDPFPFALAHSGRNDRTEHKNIPQILVFKNTPQIETICKKNNWRLLNPPSALANKVEEKISQVEWLGELAKYLPPHQIIVCKDIKWSNTPFILQFNRAHTGQGTFFIQNETELKLLKEKFPDRPVRVTDYIKGPMFTNNNVVTKEKILIGNINYQITGLAPFTDQPFSTIGNDWSLPNKLLSDEQKRQYHEIATAVGLRLSACGWKGLFGIDVVLDESTGKLYLIEINARQPASTTYESMLQGAKNKEQWNNGTMETLTTFEAHLASLLNLDLKFEITKIQDGAQIILRVQNHVQSLELNVQRDVIERLQSLDFNIIEYPNTTLGSDLLRIQSKNGIMEEHNKFNKIGKKIIESLV
jgi:predicted ATP-grasp superfamily ATP-dependent carboligase